MNPLENSDPDRINRDLRDRQGSTHYWQRMEARAAAGDTIAAARVERRNERMDRRIHRDMESGMADFNAKIQQRSASPPPPPPPKIEVDQTEVVNEPMFMFDGTEGPSEQHQTDAGGLNPNLISYLVLEDDASEIYVAKCNVNAAVTDVI